MMAADESLSFTSSSRRHLRSEWSLFDHKDESARNQRDDIFDHHDHRYHHYGNETDPNGILNAISSSGDCGGGGGMSTRGRMLLSVGSIVAFFLFLLIAVLAERRRERAAQAAALNRSSNNRAVMLDSAESVEDRYRNIEKWLVTKPIERHDELCDKVLASQMERLIPKSRSSESLKSQNSSSEAASHKQDGVEKGTGASCAAAVEEDAVRLRAATVETVSMDLESGRGSSSNDGDDDVDVVEGCGEMGCEDGGAAADWSLNTDHAHECPICFEAFQVGELVSWSAEAVCTHVFHHNCIKEWLLRNTECPFCRETFLPIDRVAGGQHQRHHNSWKTIGFLVQSQQNRSAHCYYCIQHGVVHPDCCRPNHSRAVLAAAQRENVLSPHDVELIQERAKRSPSLTDLAKMRGVQETQAEQQQQGSETATGESPTAQAASTNTHAPPHRAATALSSSCSYSSSSSGSEDEEEGDNDGSLRLGQQQDGDAAPPGLDDSDDQQQEQRQQNDASNVRVDDSLMSVEA